MSKISHSFLRRRRAVLAGLGTGILASALGGWPHTARAAPLESLVLYGPPSGPSIILTQAMASGGLPGVARTASLKVWRNPDEMRAGLSSGTMQAVVLPVQVAANLYNRGMKLKLLNVMTQGLLYVLSADPAIDSIASLKGKTLAVPFRHDMPDLVLARLLAHEDLHPGKDLTILNSGTPTEAIQMLLAGRVDAVLAPEPACTAAIARGRGQGKLIRRAVDVQQVWGQFTGLGPILPQAGLALVGPLTNADTHPGLAQALQALLAEAASAVNGDPAQAAARAAPALEYPVAILEASIPPSKLVAVPARAQKAPIEAMLSVLAERDSGIIGGHLPDDGFYL